MLITQFIVIYNYLHPLYSILLDILFDPHGTCYDFRDLTPLSEEPCRVVYGSGWGGILVQRVTTAPPIGAVCSRF